MLFGLLARDPAKLYFKPANEFERLVLFAKNSSPSCAAGFTVIDQNVHDRSN